MSAPSRPGALGAVTAALGIAAAVGATAAARASARAVRRARERERDAVRRERETRGVLLAFERAEAARRRSIARTLHGTVQNRLVLAAAGLAATAATLERTDPATAERLQVGVRQLERLYEDDVRDLVDDVCPSGAEAGLRSAVADLLDRLPPCTSASVHVGPGLRDLVDGADVVLPFAERLLAFQVVEEAVTNAVKHGRASRLDVTVDVLPLDDERLVLQVVLADDGVGTGTGRPVLRGLAHLEGRLRLRGGRLDLVHRAGGCDLAFDLPFVPVRVQPPAAGDAR